VDSVRLPALDAETLRGWTDLVLSPTGTPRIYADFNGLGNPDRTEGRLAVALDTLGTLRDLTNARLRLTEGLRLTVYDWSDDEEHLEAEATARYDPDDGLWWAELDPSVASTCRSGNVLRIRVSSALSAGMTSRLIRAPGASGHRG
jgi:hypothetical protein